MIEARLAKSKLNEKVAKNRKKKGASAEVSVVAYVCWHYGKYP